MTLHHFSQMYRIGSHSTETGRMVDTFVSADNRYFDLDRKANQYRELIRNEKLMIYEPGDWKDLCG